MALDGRRFSVVFILVSPHRAGDEIKIWNAVSTTELGGNDVETVLEQHPSMR
jgi:hypothetical protein